MGKKSQIDPPLEPPIPFGRCSNGEISPSPRRLIDAKAEELFFRLVEERSRKLGVSRRSFIESACGTATALFVMNTVYGCSDDPTQGLADAGQPRDSTTPDGGSPFDGGRYDVDAETTMDAGAACEQLSGDEFIFDVQTHHVNPQGAWRQNNIAWSVFLASLPQGACGEPDAIDCYDTGPYLREVFLNSDTHVAVLSAVPANPGSNPLEVEEAQATRTIMERLSDTERLVIHGLVLPDQGQAQLDGMDRLASDVGIAAWKVYTPFGGWRLDDPAIGIPFIEKARSLGITRICAHKGLPLVGFDPNFASPDDIGVVAAMYPDVQFIVYHSGYDPSMTEGPYDEIALMGTDRLIKSLADNNIAPNSNVYAELGTTWRDLMTKPNQAAHALGKLLRYVGEDRVLWGTDSIWYGSPQDQIMAFRSFQISAALQASYGYPELTDTIKRKVFGLNAAALYGVDAEAMRCKIDEDELTRLTAAQGLPGTPFSPTFRQYGPSTRRELFAFLKGRTTPG